MSPLENISALRVDRRTAIKWMMTAAASAALLDDVAFGARAMPTAIAATGGYGTDPDLLKTYKPGDLWPLTLTPEQRLTAAALCDLIIPADSNSPAASQLGVVDFIDEWISAPYEGHDKDRKIILDGLAWIEAESTKRFENSFPNLVFRQKTGLCEDICLVAKAKPEFKIAAQFFKRYRDLTAGGFYTTPEGMKDIGYTGNVPTVNFAGPSDEVLKKLGVI